MTHQDAGNLLPQLIRQLLGEQEIVAYIDLLCDAAIGLQKWTKCREELIQRQADKLRDQHTACKAQLADMMAHNVEQIATIQEKLTVTMRVVDMVLESWPMPGSHSELLEAARAAKELDLHGQGRQVDLLIEIAEAARGWLTRYEDEVRDSSEEAPCKRLVAAVDALTQPRRDANGTLRW